ncbi:MAG TPA: SET domain-containing protein-lysine N-methyltransferase [Bryobacteraceae bacterium]|nr:SET domain-containing protein-lysine N-methyltransferase [Bryobacteraceae bacterium]
MALAFDMGTALVKAPRIDLSKACFELEIRPSKIHRYGVYALERIPANRKVIEYTGERLNRAQASTRALGDYTYLFAVDRYWTLDGAVGGSGAEIINHCCEPNLISRVMKGHVLYMSLRAIQPGEELTIDYNFDTNTGRNPCRCGAAQCRGVMQKVKRRPK